MLYILFNSKSMQSYNKFLKLVYTFLIFFNLIFIFR